MNDLFMTFLMGRDPHNRIMIERQACNRGGGGGGLNIAYTYYLRLPVYVLV